jgi:glycosyltransferase involved in cell wall biosynthesis
MLDYLKFYPSVLRHSIQNYDIIHANFGLTGPFALAQPRRPVILSLWGSDLMGPYSYLSKQCAKYFDEVIVRSKKMQEELDSDAHVVPAGVDLSLFKPMNHQKAVNRVDWDPQRKHILFPYDPKRTIKNYPLAKSVVTGVEKKIGSPVELHVVTEVDHSRVPIYFNAADALLLTSHREGSPNTVKEAMACNTPIVSTDVGDVQERLTGVSPSAVCETESELEDALTEVVKSDHRSNGREHVQNISLEKMGEKLEKIYRKAL